MMKSKLTTFTGYGRSVGDEIAGKKEKTGERTFVVVVDEQQAQRSLKYNTYSII
jgi:hypothetical protein